MGNKEVLEEVYLSKRPLLLRFCRKITGSTAAAEDIVQTVFLKAWSCRAQFSNSKHCFRFLRRSCRNACIDLIRKGAAWRRAAARLERVVLEQHKEEERIRSLHDFSDRAVLAFRQACAERNLPAEIFLHRGATTRYAREHGIKESTMWSRCQAALMQTRKILGIA